MEEDNPGPGVDEDRARLPFTGESPPCCCRRRCCCCCCCCCCFLALCFSTDEASSAEWARPWCFLAFLLPSCSRSSLLLLPPPPPLPPLPSPPPPLLPSLPKAGVVLEVCAAATSLAAPTTAAARLREALPQTEAALLRSQRLPPPALPGEDLDDEDEE